MNGGDVIAWGTWGGHRAVVKLLSVDRWGHATILSADGHTELFEQVPAKAEPATEDERRWFEENAKPMAPPYIND